MDMSRLKRHQVEVARESILRIEGVREVLWDQWHEVRLIDRRAGTRVERALHTLAKCQGILEAHIILNGGDIDD